MPTLKKREASFGHIEVNKTSTSRVVDFDSVVATEFKLELPGVITKAVASTIVKTAINAVVAKNDSTGGLLALASSALTAVATQADTRSWRGLPKSASVLMLENNGKLDIHAPNGEELLKQSVSKSKNVLRSRFQVSYNIPRSKVSPFANVEIYNSWSLDKTRLSAGAEWSITKKHSVEAFYRFQSVNSTDDDHDTNSHILGLGYTFSF